MTKIFTMLILSTTFGVFQSSFALKLDGTPDLTFDAGGLDDSTTTILTEVIEQSDGKILIGGVFDNFEGSGREHIVRLDRDGSLDETFGVNRNITTQGGDVINEILELPNSNILVVGIFEYNYLISNASVAAPGILLVDSTGAVDESFANNINNLIPNRPIITAAHLTSNGKILIGSFGMNVQTPFVALSDIEFLILDQDGSVNTFNTPQGPVPITVSLNGVVWDIAEQSDGKILLAGAFTEANGEVANRMVRLNADFSVDDSFIASFSNTVTTISIGPNGKIYAGGQFFSVPMARESLARLNSDGSFDDAYNSNLFNISSETISTVHALPNGKLLINSLFNSGTNENVGVNRLNENGTLDHSFNHYIPESGSGVRRIAVQNDGRILGVGNFLSNFDNRGLMVRLDCADTSTFSENLEFDSSWCSAGHVAFEEEFTESIEDWDAVKSGDINDNEISFVETDINGAGTLNFHWKVSSEPGFDFFKVFIDGQEVDQISGEVGWVQKEIQLDGGNHTVRWVYEKDFSVSDGDDTAYLDNVSFTPEDELCLPIKASNGKLAIICL